MERRLLFFLAGMIMLVAIVAVFQKVNKTDRYFGALIEPPLPRADFSLRSENETVRLSDFHGKFVILYFGYTRCPDVCPATLAILREAITTVPEAEEQFQVIFISLDGGRDTPETVQGYARLFHPSFIGLTGAQEEIDEVAKDFGIYYKLNDPDPSNGHYTLDHTATTLVINPKGELILTWLYGAEAEQIAEDLKTLIRLQNK